MSNPHRARGHNWERSVIHELIKRGWDAVSSRYASRMMDDQGVDIVSDYPHKIQCKATQTTPGIHDILQTTQADVIFWRRTEKKGERFFKTSDYAILRLEDYLNLVDRAYKPDTYDGP